MAGKGAASKGSAKGSKSQTHGTGKTFVKGKEFPKLKAVKKVK